MIHCLHGAVGMAEDWKSLGHEGVDLWNLLEEGECSLAEAGERIAEGAEDGDRLMGYSMGGRIALHALLSGRCEWKEAVIYSAHPGLLEGREERVETDERWARLAEEDWGRFLEEWNGQGILGGEPDWGDRLKLVERRKEVARSFRCWSLGRQEDLRSRLGAIRCPVRWVVGEKDEKFVRLAEEVVPLIPEGRLEVVRGAGHRVPWGL
ncbi:MAG: alpha/beta fold hydrolase [Verrucomicrobiaceae bacterium]